MEEIVLSIDPVLMGRLKVVHSFEKNLFTDRDKKPPLEQWLLEEIAFVVEKEELRLVNQSFYSQRARPGEDIDKKQVIEPKYVPPILIDGLPEACFSDGLAVELGVLDFKKRGEHIYWNCCECYHCEEDQEDYWNRDRCLCHQESCVCWCDERHSDYHIIYKDDVKYQMITKKPDGKCPGHYVFERKHD